MADRLRPALCSGVAETRAGGLPLKATISKRDQFAQQIFRDHATRLRHFSSFSIRQKKRPDPQVRQCSDADPLAPVADGATVGKPDKRTCHTCARDALTTFEQPDAKQTARAAPWTVDKWTHLPTKPDGTVTASVVLSHPVSPCARVRPFHSVKPVHLSTDGHGFFREDDPHPGSPCISLSQNTWGRESTVPASRWQTENRLLSTKLLFAYA